MYIIAMVFKDLLATIGDEPVFETGFLLAGVQNPVYIRRQLTEWVDAGKLWQLRRGLYATAPPYQKTHPHPFVVANRMVPGSYVSLQSALAYYDLIPEYVPAVTSVTARRSGHWRTPLGEMIYRVIRRGLIFGYERIIVAAEQWAFVAMPEKALLDLIYLHPGGDDRAYIESLRLQNMERIDQNKLLDLAEKMKKPKLKRAARIITALAEAERELYEPV
jgi:predicted transcriptional regulator of viral defense system